MVKLTLSTYKFKFLSKDINYNLTPTTLLFLVSSRVTVVHIGNNKTEQESAVVTRVLKNEYETGSNIQN